MIYNEIVSKFIHQYHPKGINILIFDTQGKTIYEHYVGTTGTAHPLDIHTRFGIASMTKSFVASSILICAEKGLLKLSDPVSKYLPELKNPEITIHHYLTHSSGMPPMKRTLLTDISNKFPDRDLVYNPELAQVARQKIINAINAVKKPLANPGQVMSYSNDSYGLLSEIVREVGPYPTFTEFVEQEIFKPLGLERTSFRFNELFDDENTSHLYEPESTDYTHRAFALYGSGAIKSTLFDLKQFVLCFLQNKSPFLSPASLIKMQTPYISCGYQKSQGYGLMISDHELIGHDGSLPGVSSSMLWDPKKGLGCIILCNTDNIPVNLLSQSLLANFETKIEYEDRDITVWYGSYEDEEESKAKLNQDAIIINDNEYSYQTLKNNYLIVQKDSSPMFVECVKVEENKVGLRIGSRILPRKES